MPSKDFHLWNNAATSRVGHYRGLLEAAPLYPMLLWRRRWISVDHDGHKPRGAANAVHRGASGLARLMAVG